MLLIRGLHNLRAEHRECVATIGNFDGVHLGHQAVLAALDARARAAGVPSLVIIFEPQPLEFFRPQQAPARLTRLREKLEAIAACGVDRVLLVRFDAEFAAVPADAFVRDVLVDRLAIRHLYVGDDFRFGRDRAGDFAMLTRMGGEHGFGVESLATVADDGERISSTRIREALERGDMDEAARCLGRRYRIAGRVAHGNKRGRTIGFPTLNIGLLRRSTPLLGVYAVQVFCLDIEPLPGVANIGSRPTLTGDERVLLEVHLFDFDADVYGRHVEVDFVEHIRDERRFDSFELLREQIGRDVQRARRIHGLDAVAHGQAH
ncbi:MAG: bifunctional riboflavin kinase/FAD synthetase [Chromatiaceae bacterium]|nr:bifunctional riboflavin kinase/FAD synthetase [Gammaproteobacteria bacterium]MCP5414624.1 bifunctional riboflavin kinase/FAD synthetase [Chromatiaceae bacterium]MCP5421977.1 bifunctional riboflavin kinase/FAD synthetase [Chromatiaceae bacterium]